VASLRDIIKRTPRQFEELFGCHTGQLSSGYRLLVLKETLSPSDLNAADHLRIERPQLMSTYSPRGNPVSRAGLRGALVIDFAAYACAKLARDLTNDIQLQGPDRLVKIVPLEGPPPSKALSPLASARRGGPRMLNLKREKQFLVAAEIDSDNRFCGRGLSLLLDAYTRYDQRSSIVSYLAAA
jgi:hypothetical protein